MKNAKVFIGTVATSAVLAFSAMAMAQDAARPAPPEPTQRAMSWQDLDADSNGTLSKQEVASVEMLSQAFDSADTNSDGQLSMEEYQAHAQQQSTAPAPTSAPPMEQPPAREN